MEQNKLRSISRLNVRSAGHYWALLIVQQLLEQGICDVCIAPGSRSTPIVKAFHDEKKFRISTHFDERSLGFFALGRAKQSQKPVVILTTSGTAVANLLPACAEAFAMQVPLIILSADRPAHLHQCGANQTMNQEGLFSQFVQAQLMLPTASFELDEQPIQEEIKTVLLHSKQGPVHINMPIDEPLLSETLFELPQLNKLKTLCQTQVYHPIRSNLASLYSEQIKILCKDKKVLCMTAITARSYDSDRLEALLTEQGVAIFSEVTARSRFSTSVHRALSLLDQIEEPDVIICIGAKWISKKVQALLSKTNQVILIHDFQESQDFLKCAALQCHLSIDDCMPCLSELGCDRGYAARVEQQIISKTQVKIAANLEEEFMQCLSESCGDNLFLGNSLVIRQFNDRFNSRSTQLTIQANRGVSGIDGVVSTAAGVCYQSQVCTVLVNGDMSSLHDSNGFYFMAKYKLPLLIIILNNNGGGIFSTLAIKNETELFENYFKMPHNLNFKSIADLYSIDYAQASEISSFKKSYALFMKNKCPMLIELLI